MGIKRNFIFSTVLTASNYIFPFIIFPYVSRVLGPTNVGICNYVDSIVNYSTMISMMGISVVGIREIAKAKTDRIHLDKTFSALTLICTIFTLIATIALVGATLLVEELHPYKSMLMIGIMKLWGNFLLIDWLYRGLEDFKYITIRTIAVKFAFLISVFILIHKASDYMTYYLLICLQFAVNAAINCLRASKIVTLRFDRKYIKAMLPPMIAFGVYILLNSMYTTFNTLYLGSEHGDTQVGYYTTATKIFNIILAIYTAYSGVVMPRVSALLSEKKIDEFKTLIGKSIRVLLLFAVPAVSFCMLFSDGIVYLIAGKDFTGAIMPMTLVSPLIFIIGYEQILVIQILTPITSDRAVLFNSAIGATVGIVGNLLLVRHLAAVGSAIVWLSAEITVLVLSQYFVKRRIGLSFPFKDFIVNIAAYIPYVLIAVAIIAFVPLPPIGKMFIGLGLIAVYFFAIQLLVLRDDIFLTYYNKIKARICRR